MTCHTPNANFVLGVKTAQLNGDFTYPSTGITDNQLSTWNHLGMFSQDVEARIPNLPKAVSLDDPRASLEAKVNSYLEANCAHCHRAGGVEGAFDARFSIPMDKKKLIGVEGKSRNTPPGGILVVPGDPQNSQLYARDETLGTGAMPPLGKTVNDDPYLAVLADWINSLKPPADPVDPIEEEPTDDPMDDGESEKKDDDDMGDPNIPMGSDGIWIEAECGQLGEQWELIADGNASGDFYITIPNQNLRFINKASEDPRYAVTFTFHTTEAGLYKIFTRTIAPNSGDDSFWVRVNDARWIRFNNIDKDESLIWDQVHDNTKGDQVVLFEARKGENTLQISLREDGTALDKIYLTKDGESPEGEGAAAGNCEFPPAGNGITPPTVHFGELQAKATIAGGNNLEMTVGPNPFKEHFNIVVKRPETGAKRAILRIFDLNGRIIYQRFDVPFDTPVAVEQLAGFEPGIYFVRLQSGNYARVNRLLKQ